MDSKYLECLFFQFCRAKGIIVNNKNKKIMSAFTNWLNEYKNLVIDYAKFVTNLGIDLKSHELAEVGKGRIDSIVSYPAKVISPHANSLGRESSSLLIIGNTPAISTSSGLITISDINTFITHNPYNEKLISGWDELHNDGNHDILVGVFGKKNDKDEQAKLDMLNRLFNKLNHDSEIISDYDTSYDSYFAVVKSDRVKLRNKVK